MNIAVIDLSASGFLNAAWRYLDSFSNDGHPEVQEGEQVIGKLLESEKVYVVAASLVHTAEVESLKSLGITVTRGGQLVPIDESKKLIDMAGVITRHPPEFQRAEELLKKILVALVANRLPEFNPETHSIVIRRGYKIVIKSKDRMAQDAEPIWLQIAIALSESMRRSAQKR